MASVHESPQKALEKVGGEFEYWSGKLTDSSLQLCYAVVGANRVVFGSVDKIKNSFTAELSLFLVMLTLASNVITALLGSENMRLRYGYAEKDPDRWETEFKAVAGRTPWPFTNFSEWLGIITRYVKAFLPLAAGIALIVGALHKLS